MLLALKGDRDDMLISNHTIPMVIESEGRVERSFDIFSRLLKDRIIFVGAIDSDQRADLIIAQLLYLTSEDDKKNIHMYINSPGGVVTAGLAIYDTMQYIPNDIATIVIGQACSMGSVIAAAGTKGKRLALPNSRIMIHQPIGGTQGQESDIIRQAKEMERIRSCLENILSYHTGKDVSQVHHDCDRDNFMTAEQAVEYGLIDRVLFPGETLDSSLS